LGNINLVLFFKNVEMISKYFLPINRLTHIHFCKHTHILTQMHVHTHIYTRKENRPPLKKISGSVLDWQEYLFNKFNIYFSLLTSLWAFQSFLSTLIDVGVDYRYRYGCCAAAVWHPHNLWSHKQVRISLNLLLSAISSFK
jgi:hypothetical protein